MELNHDQHDALVELLNIGFGRAGASLSKLTNQRVLLEVPRVAVHPITHLNQSLGKIVDERVASVHQVFKGPVAGDALLHLAPVHHALGRGNLLSVPMSFSVPEVDVDSVHQVIDRLIEHGDAFRYALIVTAGFRLRDSAVTGYVGIVLTVQSLKRLLDALDNWQRAHG